MAFPAYVAATASERVEEAAFTGAQTLVTACSRCGELNFNGGGGRRHCVGRSGADWRCGDGALELVALSAGVTKEAS